MGVLVLPLMSMNLDLSSFNQGEQGPMQKTEASKSIF